MGRGVEGERQLQHVLEIVRHHGEPPAVREPVGMERDEDAGADGEEAERRPRRTISGVSDREGHRACPGDLGPASGRR